MGVAASLTKRVIHSQSQQLQPLPPSSEYQATGGGDSVDMSSAESAEADAMIKAGFNDLQKAVSANVRLQKQIVGLKEKHETDLATAASAVTSTAEAARVGKTEALAEQIAELKQQHESDVATAAQQHQSDLATAAQQHESDLATTASTVESALRPLQDRIKVQAEVELGLRGEIETVGGEVAVYQTMLGKNRRTINMLRKTIDLAKLEVTELKAAAVAADHDGAARLLYPARPPAHAQPLGEKTSRSCLVRPLTGSDSSFLSVGSERVETVPSEEDEEAAAAAGDDWVQDDLRGPEQREYVRQAQSAFKSGLYLAAVQMYTRAVEAGGPTTSLLSNRAAAHLECGSPALALEDAAEAGRLMPESVTAHYRKSRAHLELSKISAATALRLNPGHEKARGQCLPIFLPALPLPLEHRPPHCNPTAISSSSSQKRGTALEQESPAFHCGATTRPPSRCPFCRPSVLMAASKLALNLTNAWRSGGGMSFVCVKETPLTPQLDSSSGAAGGDAVEPGEQVRCRTAAQGSLCVRCLCSSYISTTRNAAACAGFDGTAVGQTPGGAVRDPRGQLAGDGRPPASRRRRAFDPSRPGGLPRADGGRVGEPDRGG